MPLNCYQFDGRIAGIVDKRFTSGLNALQLPRWQVQAFSYYSRAGILLLIIITLVHKCDPGWHKRLRKLPLFVVGVGGVRYSSCFTLFVNSKGFRVKRIGVSELRNLTRKCISLTYE